jgi:hypothetical protein
VAIDGDDLIGDERENERLGAPRSPSRTRRILVRIVGYTLIGMLFWGTHGLILHRPIRDAILDFTTFGRSSYIEAAEKRVRDFVSRLRSR